MSDAFIPCAQFPTHPTFNNTNDVLDFLFDELIATLEDDADNCEAEEDFSAAAALRAKIADIEAIWPHTKVVMP